MSYSDDVEYPDTADDELCWVCHGDGGYHECGEDSCPCLYKEGEPDDEHWVDCSECDGTGYC